MQIATFETAKKLKEAGFPQPLKYEFGQVFYFPEGHGLGYDCFCVDHTMVITGSDVPHEFIFAPSATDILRHLPLFEMQAVEDVWHVYNEETLAYSVNDNPAEAAAAAWLALHKK